MIIFKKTWLFIDMEFFSLNIRRGNLYLCLRMYYSLCKFKKTTTTTKVVNAAKSLI